MEKKLKKIGPKYCVTECGYLSLYYQSHKKKNAVQDTIISFLKNAPNYKQVHTFQTIADALGCVNLSSGDSGWYTPKAIKIEGVDGIFCLRQSGCINPEFKIQQTSAGFEVLEMTPQPYRDLEKIAST